MTKIKLLRELQMFTALELKDLLLPVSYQATDKEKPEMKPPQVYICRLPDGRQATKKAPYVLHQVVTWKDQRPQGSHIDCSAVVRSVFCTYNRDEQQGGIDLLEMMERFRVALLRQAVLGRQFHLALEDGLEGLIYQEDTAPYYIGEMVSDWKVPPVERELEYRKELYHD